MQAMNILSLQESEYNRAVKGLVIGYVRSPEAFEGPSDLFEAPINLAVVSTTKEASAAFVQSQLNQMKNPEYGNVVVKGVRDVEYAKVFAVKGYVIFTPDLEFVDDYYFTHAVQFFVDIQPSTGSMFFDRVSLVIPQSITARVYDTLFKLWKKEQPQYMVFDRPKRSLDEDDNRYIMFADKMLQTRTHELKRDSIEGREIYLSDEIDTLDAWFVKATIPMLIQMGAKFVYLSESVQRKLFLHDIIQSQYLTGDFIGQVGDVIESSEEGFPV